MNLTRRRLLLGTTAGALLAGCRSAPPAPAEPVTPEEALYLESRERMLKKFGRPGFELVVDAKAGQEFLGVEFFAEHAKHKFYAKGGQRLDTQGKMVLSQPVPERVRIVWRDSSKFVPDGRALYAGNIIGDELLEVGSRIPQELIDELKRDPRGSLRLKFRMSEQGTLFGWDIERRPGLHSDEARKARAQGKDLYYPPGYSHTGGDFKEARPAYYVLEGHDFIALPRTLPDPLSAADQALLKQHHLVLRDASRRLWEKGWYIDRRTGRTVETDF